jgi:predicted enzyme related to lactoylglutathione lyase
VDIQINLDCHDLDSMVAFYTAALDYEPFGTAGDRYRSIVPKHGDGPKVVFQKVPDAKAGKNRMHLDLIVGDALDSEVERFVALGARRLADEPFDEPFDEYGCRWVVLSDPEGNELCLCSD